MDTIREMAQNVTEFIQKYKDVEDVYRDSRGIEILSDFAYCLGCDILICLRNKPVESPPQAQEE